MTENTEPRTETADGQQLLPQQAQTQATASVPYGAQPLAAYGIPIHGAPLGQVRSTGACIALTIVTLGIYSWVWYFKTHEEMKRHTNTGLGGGLALVLAIFVGIVMPFISSSEVGGLYERRGMRAPVSGATGLWALLLGWFFGVGLIVWFVKTNGALNDYWRSQGAR
ncbi:DUF4234 domain-containing protein [Nocardioides terrigena]|uniref:DUF4234 domain-containing protein n=1 Tax=Nocardioides terrigena TaxID=424797 RepID=UPI000D30EC98|nr:DUF4234 domain-containing protein [Nocardioides terrigena]